MSNEKQSFMDWFDGVRKKNTMADIGFLFGVIPSDVRDWMAAGLEHHALFDVPECRACLMYPAVSGAPERWGIHPLAVMDWLNTRTPMQETFLVRAILDRAEEVYPCNRKRQNVTLPVEVDPDGLTFFAAWFWRSHIEEPIDETVAMKGDPFVWLN